MSDGFGSRLGLAVPNEWWPASPLLKSYEAAGFGLVQVPSPPPTVLADARQLGCHARAVRAGLDTTGLSPVVHGPGTLLAGEPEADAAFEGMLAYAAEIGAELVVYHAHALPDHASSEDRLLAETRSLARHATRAERLGVTIAVENLASTFPGPERLSDTPLTLRTLVHRIGSPRVGICLDLGHAHVTAELRHASIEHLVAPALDEVVLFHLHDNLGARWDRTAAPAGLDPLRLDLHLAPGRGTLPWDAVAPMLAAHSAPLLLEVHPPNRPPADELIATTTELLAPAAPQPIPAAG